MVEVIMPKMGDAMEEGTLVEWLKREGDAVTTDEVIANIQTDKAVVELTAPATGTLAGVLVKQEETVPVGQRIAAVLQDGEKLPGGWGTGAVAPAAAPPAVKKAEAPAAPVAEAVVAVPEGRIKASPLARKMAADLGIDLVGVRGSGPGGRIVEKDVKGYKPSTAPAVASPEAAAPVGARSIAPAGKPREITKLRQLIAEHTLQAKREAPHFYVTVEVDVEELQDLRHRMNDAQPDAKVSVNDFVIKACALALRDMPEVNSNFSDGQWMVSDAINIGMAVATDAGLLVPVIKSCEGKSLRGIAAEAKVLAPKVRDGKVTLDELSGSTFSISNMGMLNVDNFTAILNYPNGAIVAISTAHKVAAVMPDGSIQPRERMNLTGSFDHRTQDGAVGARFMNVLRDYLQAPVMLLT